MDRTIFRKYSRAPLRTQILFEDEKYFHLARVLNISMNGVLLDELPYFPRKDEILVFLDIPQVHSLKDFTLESLLELQEGKKNRDIFKVKTQIVRKDAKNLGLEKLMRFKLAGTFVYENPEMRNAIQNYIDSYIYNIVYLVRIFEKDHLSDEETEKALLLAHILDYDSSVGVSMLREKVALDYRNL
jgi:hypothetical protein